MDNTTLVIIAIVGIIVGGFLWLLIRYLINSAIDKAADAIEDKIKQRKIDKGKIKPTGRQYSESENLADRFKNQQ